MKVARENRPIYLDGLDLEKRFFQEADSSTVVFVDSRALRKRYPNLVGRVVLQDQPEIVDHVKADLASAGIEAKVHNLFTPQPVRGAHLSTLGRKGVRAYYMGHVFHAWGNPPCKEILANIKEGMNEDSVLIIDDIVALCEESS
ncbi:hypothetical protein PG991_000498 [Apiospora marii]|uniref:O-methyltransferase domain-containing protein n=1 Tax=Apiospora marii TaxID=335849 RepID=A0ABR1T291_9PEZI